MLLRVLLVLALLLLTSLSRHAPVDQTLLELLFLKLALVHTERERERYTHTRQRE